jgi:hypothetical protein
MSRDIFNIIQRNPLCEDLYLDDDFVLYVKEHDARSDERKARPIDLKRYWLPTNTVYDQPLRFVDYDHYLVSLVYGLDYFARTNLPSNSKCNRICFMINSIIKFFEYCWLNTLFNLSEISASFTLKLANSLARDGWHNALNMDARVNSFLDTAHCADHPVFKSTNSNLSLSAVGFQSAIATNITGQEVAVYFNRIREFQVVRGWRETFRPNGKVSKGMQFSLLRQTLESINLLVHSDDENKVHNVPYPNYVRLAKKLTDSPGTTVDINSHDAGKLLEYSLEFVNSRSDRILRLLAFAGRSLNSSRSVQVKLKKVTCFARRIGYIDRDAIAPTGIRDMLTFLNSAMKDLLNACFIVIAIFNARRKREITHKKYGLSLGSGKIVNERAGIYIQKFYVEKTLKDYVSFYIAPATKKAITILEKLQLIFLDKPYKNHNFASLTDANLTLFRLKVFDASGFVKNYSQFDFECHEPRKSGNFIHSAIGKSLRLTPHMFRRLYCKIFINRYEYFMLPFLSYQLQHEDISTTQIYVSNPQAQTESAELSKLYDWNLCSQSEALIIHNDEIMMSMAEVTREKFSEIVYRSISAQNTSGGYAKLVRALYKKMFSSVEYGKPNLKHVETLLERLRSRGHGPHPFKHAQCMAGANKIKSKSKCWKPYDNKLHKENASPKLCQGCLFSWTSEEHVSGMESDLADMKTAAYQLQESSIAKKNLQLDIEEIEDVLLYHKSYLGKCI